jgi:hypothetical protein
VFETATGINKLSSDDAQLTPIFNALVQGGGDPAARFDRDPLGAPLPAGAAPARLHAVTGEPTVAEPRRPGDAVCSPARARHAAPVAAAVNAPTVTVRRPATGAHRAVETVTAGPGRGGRHRALRAVSHGTA